MKMEGISKCRRIVAERLRKKTSMNQGTVANFHDSHQIYDIVNPLYCNLFNVTATESQSYVHRGPHLWLP